MNCPKFAENLWFSRFPQSPGASATTVRRAQGMTVDAAHVLVERTMTRKSPYVELSRGRAANRAYVVTGESP